MKKILVFGATGMIGHQLWLQLRRSFSDSVHATIRGKKSDYSALKIYDQASVHENIDVRDFSGVQALLAKVRPSEIINCTGITLRKPEINDLNLTYEVNSIFPRRLAKWAQVNNARVIHFSTDCVFDGKKGFYTEADVPTAADTYGKSKFLGELNEAHCLTLRFPVIGREIAGKTELLEWFLSQKGKEVRGFSEALYSGVTTQVAAREVLRLIEKFPNLQGLYHVSNDPINKHELLSLINKHFDLRVKLLKDSSYSTNKVLNSDAYRKLTGFKSLNWDQMLQELVSFKEISYGEV